MSLVANKKLQACGMAMQKGFWGEGCGAIFGCIAFLGPVKQRCNSLDVQGKCTWLLLPGLLCNPFLSFVFLLPPLHGDLRQKIIDHG